MRTLFSTVTQFWCTSHWSKIGQNKNNLQWVNDSIPNRDYLGILEKNIILKFAKT